MSNSLQMLPPEVLNLLISLIDDLPSLAVLTRICKHLNQLTLPHLYAHVSFVGGWGDTGNKHLRPFTFLILQKPQLAALIRTFTLRAQYATEYVYGDGEKAWKLWPKNDHLDLVLKTAVNEHLERNTGPAVDDEVHEPPDDEADEWFQVLRAGQNEAAILALLLPKLVNLQSMDIPFNTEHSGTGGEITSADSHYIRKKLERTLTRQALTKDRRVFGSLTDVMIPGTDDKYPDDPDFFSACFGLPAIKRLYGFNQGNEDDSRRPAHSQFSVFSQIEPDSSSLEYIELRHSKLNIPNFSKFLRAPKCLKTFIYEIGNTWAWTVVKTSEIQLALNFQKHDLERLCISHAPFYPFFAGNGDELTPLSFSDFSALKHLRVAPVYLYGGERLQLRSDDAMRDADAPAVSDVDLEITRMLLLGALPPQLETLGFVRCNDDSTLGRLLISLRELRSYKEKQFPSLREVSIHGMNAEALKPAVGVMITMDWKACNVRIVGKVEAKVGYEPKNYSERRWGWDEDIEWAECIHNNVGPVDVLWSW